MIKKAKKKPAIKNGWVFGYDPGGNGNHGVAAIRVNSGRVTECLCRTFDSAQEVFEWINEDKRPMLAIGVDTLTHWNMGWSGWREADLCLHKKYPAVRSSVQSPNGLFSAMPVNGMTVLMKMRKKHPRIHVTETHPKVLYYALTGRKHNYKKNKVRMDQRLTEWLGLKHPPLKRKIDHEWDALISAYAALQGMRGRWTTDLAALSKSDSSVVWPCGRVHYWWPGKIT